MNEEDKKFYTTSAFLMIDDLKKENKQLRERIDEAIKYINENKQLSMFNDCSEPEEDWSYDLECDANDLLNILEGKYEIVD